MVAAALGTWVSKAAGILSLLVGGALIFSLTTLALKAAGRDMALSSGSDGAPGHPDRLHRSHRVGGGARRYGSPHRLVLPGRQLIVGAHYLPFVFLYGMRLFAALAGVMIFAGGVLGLWVEGPFATGGWLGAAALVVFAFLLRADHHRTAHSANAITRGE